MQDLTPSEIEALSRAMGNSFVEKPNPAVSTKQKLEKKTPGTPTSSISRAQFSQVQEEPAASLNPSPLQDHLMDMKVQIDVIFGRRKMALGDLMQLHQGSIIELNKLAGEPVDIEANGKLIGRGEIVVVENNFGVKIIEFT